MGNYNFYFNSHLSTQCLKYQTDQLQDVKKLEKLNNILMRHMVAKWTVEIFVHCFFKSLLNLQKPFAVDASWLYMLFTMTSTLLHKSQQCTQSQKTPKKKEKL